LLAACSGNPSLPSGTGSVQPAHYGATAADDPQAALIGRDIISAGGSAADAAVAMYFAMSVTLPGTAGLGGGGICLAFSPADKSVETLDFLARSPNAVPPTADRPTAVPGNPRGFFALHARFGRIRWAELLAPAENLARFGTPVSRGLAHQLRPVGSALTKDPEFRRIFSRPDGSGIVDEGDTLVQLDLATTISRIRTGGPSDFYGGPFAAQLVEATAKAGGSLDRADLTAMLPVWQSPIVVTGDGRKAFFPAPPPVAGAIQGQMWSMLANGDRFADASAGEREHLLAEAAIAAFGESDRGTFSAATDPQALMAATRIEEMRAHAVGKRNATSGPVDGAGESRLQNPSGAGLVAVDGAGNAVACSVTLNSLFGTGRIAPGTGIVLASDPGTGGRGASMLAPMLMTNDSTRYFYYASTATGGVAAPQAQIAVAAYALFADQPLAEAMAHGRIMALPETDRVLVEHRLGSAETSAIQQGGLVPQATDSLGEVNAVSCPKGVPNRPDSCLAAADPRGFGLGTTTQ
jgi:Gamma-glutamyltransferase